MEITTSKEKYENTKQIVFNLIKLIKQLSFFMQ